MSAPGRYYLYPARDQSLKGDLVVYEIEPSSYERSWPTGFMARERPAWFSDGTINRVRREWKLMNTPDRSVAAWFDTLEEAVFQAEVMS